MTPGPARHVGHPAGRDPVKQSADNALLRPEQRVVLIVVGLRPTCVPVAYGNVANVNQRFLMIDGTDDPPYFHQPFVQEGPV